MTFASSMWIGQTTEIQKQGCHWPQNKILRACLHDTTTAALPWEKWVQNPMLLTAPTLSMTMAPAPSHVNAPIETNEAHFLHDMALVPAPSLVNDAISAKTRSQGLLSTSERGHMASDERPRDKRGQIWPFSTVLAASFHSCDWLLVIECEYQCMGILKFSITNQIHDSNW